MAKVLSNGLWSVMPFITHKDSGITNNPNDWATEHDNPRYILDLLLSVILLSIEMMEIVNGLPKLTF